MRQYFRSLLKSFIRIESSISPHFKDQLIIIGTLSNTSCLDCITNASYWRKYRIYWNNSDRLIRFLISVTCKESASNLNLHVHFYILILISCTDYLFLVDHFKSGRKFQLPRCDGTFRSHIQSNFLWLSFSMPEFNFLKIKNDISNVFNNSLNSSKLMVRTFNFN